MEAFAEYGHALVAIGLTALIWAVLNPVSSIMKQGQVAPGGVSEQDYSSPAYRWYRAYQNLTESFGPFAGTAIAAMLAGAPPFWVNLFASVFLVGRLLMLVVHIRGVGRPNAGPRTLMFVLGWASTIALAILTIVAVF